MSGLSEQVSPDERRQLVQAVHSAGYGCACEPVRNAVERILVARTERARPEPSAREQLIDALADSMNAGAPRPEHVVKAEALRAARDDLYAGMGPDLYADADIIYGEWLGNRADALEVQP